MLFTSAGSAGRSSATDRTGPERKIGPVEPCLVVADFPA